jgi:hypothetical protein
LVVRPKLSYSLQFAPKNVQFECAAQSALAVSYNLAGVSVFALGFEDQSFWDAVHAGGF